MLEKKSLRLAGLLIIAASSLKSQAQTLDNLNAKLEGDKVVITYNLKNADAAEKFKVTFYSSHDGYTYPLSSVTGDVGDNVKSGTGKRAIWDAKNALSADFDGDINIKVKALKLMAPYKPMEIKPMDVNVYKRGRTIELKWEGGSPNDKLNVELYRNDVLQYRLADKVNNNNTYAWQMPKNQKAGKDYQIRLLSSTKPGEVANSQTFQIKPRLPLLVKVLPFLAIGATLAILGGSDPDSSGATDVILPGPTKPN